MEPNGKKERTIAKRQRTVKKELLKYLQDTGIIHVACRKCSIGRQTYYRWLREDPEFKKAARVAIKEGREVNCDMAESVIIAKVMEKDIGAAKFILQHNDERYMSPTRLEQRTRRRKARMEKELTYHPEPDDADMRALGREFDERVRALIVKKIQARD